ncbi:type I restriction-modification system, DNA-methyltransferase subunit M [Helicobacter cinaedi]|nr:type I restriction-modification system, DNA-methyltransferase subunit M [Helicobacter cinaedi]
MIWEAWRGSKGTAKILAESLLSGIFYPKHIDTFYLRQRRLMITQDNLQEVLEILGFESLSTGGGGQKAKI